MNKCDSKDIISYSKNNKRIKLNKTVVILGSAEVGKTNILQKYTKKRFEESYLETIGVDYYSREITSKEGNIILSIWDTCGNENELKILPSNVYKIASAFIIVCSYDKRDSFEMLQNWITHLQTFLSQRTNNIYHLNSHLIPIVILINKCDLKSNRTFKISDIFRIIDEFNLNILVYEVSAKENTKLDYVFEKIIGIISGKLSIANEVNSNLSVDDNLVSTAQNTERGIENRRKSFQLTNQISEIRIDKEKTKQGSCCNNN